MRSLIFAFAVMAIGLPSSQASPMPCVAAEDTILVNLTNNQGCTTKEYKALCSQFAKCLREHRVCVLGRGGLAKGDTLNEIPIKNKSIVFGINQTLKTMTRSYCVMAGLAMPTEGMNASWYYRTFTPNGGWIGEEITDPSESPKSLYEFSKKTTEDFHIFLEKIRKELKSSNFKDGEYGYHKGEEP